MLKRSIIIFAAAAALGISTSGINTTHPSADSISQAKISLAAKTVKAGKSKKSHKKVRRVKKQTTKKVKRTRKAKKKVKQPKKKVVKSRKATPKIRKAALKTRKTTPKIRKAAPKGVKRSQSQKASASMTKFVKSTLNKYHLRGRVTVVQNYRPQTIGYGYAWYGKRIFNNSSRVVYPTGSMQKVATGAMIVQLINEKLHTNQKFSQYTKISRWYPNLKNANQITVGELMTQTSGIRLGNTELDRKYRYSETSAVNYIVNQVNRSSVAQPGTYHYTNANFILLAGIISKLTGQSYEANLNSRIIRPLGLTNTYLLQNVPRGKTDAISYIWRNGKNYQSPNYMRQTQASQIVGAGNLYTTPDDFYKILQGVSNGRILSSSDFHYLTHLKAKKTSYSGGLYLKNVGNRGQVKMAYGSISGNHYSSWYQLTDDNGNGIVMMLNQTYNNGEGYENTAKDAGYEILQHIQAGRFSRR